MPLHARIRKVGSKQRLRSNAATTMSLGIFCWGRIVSDIKEYGRLGSLARRPTQPVGPAASEDKYCCGNFAREFPGNIAARRALA